MTRCQCGHEEHVGRCRALISVLPPLVSRWCGCTEFRPVDREMADEQNETLPGEAPAETIHETGGLCEYSDPRRFTVRFYRGPDHEQNPSLPGEAAPPTIHATGACADSPIHADSTCDPARGPEGVEGGSAGVVVDDALALQHCRSMTTAADGERDYVFRLRHLTALTSTLESHVLRRYTQDEAGSKDCALADWRTCPQCQQRWPHPRVTSGMTCPACRCAAAERARDAALAEAIAARFERDEARANASILAHAYEHDSRPPWPAVAESLAYPLREKTSEGA